MMIPRVMMRVRMILFNKPVPFQGEGPREDPLSAEREKKSSLTESPQLAVLDFQEAPRQFLEL